MLNNETFEKNPSVINDSISNVFSSHISFSLNPYHTCEKSLYVPYIIIPTSKLLNINFLKTIAK